MWKIRCDTVSYTHLVHNGLYQILLAMKYLRSSDEEWTAFVDTFDKLIQNNIGVVSLTAMNLPDVYKRQLLRSNFLQC